MTSGSSAALPAFPPKGDLCGIGYSRGTIQQFHAAICGWLRGGRSRTASVSYVNPHVFNLAVENQALRTFLEEADIVAVDGVGISLALWLFHRERQERTVMTPLFDSVLQTPDLPDVRAVVIGGPPEVARKGSEAITRAGRKVQVTAFIDGYQPLDRYLDFVEEHAGAELILVAMGSPRSEEFILRAAPLCPGRLLWNIGGGTLNFYAGALRRVPKIVSRLWLQWLWRMVWEPNVAPRYVIGIPVFARRLIRASAQEKNKKGACVC